MKNFLKSTKGKIIAGGITLAVVAVAVVIIILMNRGYRSIKVDDLNGTTIVSGREAFKGQNLKNGDDVSVSESSDLTLELDSDKHVFAEEHTRFRVEAAGKSGRNSRTVIHLEEGSVLTTIDNKLADKESYVVETPNAAMAVRGTTFSVAASSTDDAFATTVEVIEGTVEVTDKETGEVTVLNAGESKTIASGGMEPTYGDETALAVEAAIETFLKGGELDTAHFDEVTELEISGTKAFVRVGENRWGKGVFKSSSKKGDGAEVTYTNSDGEQTMLVTEDHSLENLDFVAEMTNLKRLFIDQFLRKNKISDISELAKLTNLEQLDLQWNNISDLTPLAGLTNLKVLNLWRNDISDITLLAGLTNLEELDLSQNRHISDITPLAGLTNLTRLDLGYVAISDITPLAGLTNLEWLELGSCNISDITPIAGLTNLQLLELGGNDISDITPIAKFTNLKWLYLGGNDISDITPLAELTSIKWLVLDLSGNNISDITPLAGLTGLEWLRLELDGNNISDITPLAGLTGMAYLNLDDNNISDITPILGLSNLTYLEVKNTNISDADIERLKAAFPNAKIVN